MGGVDDDPQGLPGISHQIPTLVKLDELGFMAEIKASEHFFFEDITLINAYKV